MEDVGVPLEQRHVGVHAGSGVFREGFRHERRVDALGDGHLPDDDSEGHDVVRHGQGIRVAEVDLVLPG